MTHHQQAVVTGFTLANDVNAAQYREETRVAFLACRYDPFLAVQATRRLRADSLLAGWDFSLDARSR
jgi:hypothetical protein